MVVETGVEAILVVATGVEAVLVVSPEAVTEKDNKILIHNLLI